MLIVGTEHQQLIILEPNIAAEASDLLKAAEKNDILEIVL